MSVSTYTTLEKSSKLVSKHEWYSATRQMYTHTLTHSHTQKQTQTLKVFPVDKFGTVVGENCGLSMHCKLSTMCLLGSFINQNLRAKKLELKHISILGQVTKNCGIMSAVLGCNIMQSNGYVLACLPKLCIDVLGKTKERVNVNVYIRIHKHSE